MLFHQKHRGLAQPTLGISEKLGVRTLHLGNSDTQSAMRIVDPDTLVLAYSRCMFGFFLWCDIPRHALLIGLGGGSIPKWVHRHLIETHLTCIELYPEVIQAARSMFFLPRDDERLSVFAGDGAAYLSETEKKFDLLMMDAYSATGIADTLTTVDFFKQCHDRLNKNGILAINLWRSDPYFKEYEKRLTAVFGNRLLCLPARKQGNILVFALKEGLEAEEYQLQWTTLSKRAKNLKLQYGLEFDQFVSDLTHFNPHNAQRVFMK